MEAYRTSDLLCCIHVEDIVKDPVLRVILDFELAIVKGMNKKKSKKKIHYSGPVTVSASSSSDELWTSL